MIQPLDRSTELVTGPFFYVRRTLMITSIWFKRVLYFGWFIAVSSMTGIAFGEGVKASDAQVEQTQSTPESKTAARPDMQKKSADATVSAEPKDLKQKKDQGPVTILKVDIMDSETADMLTCSKQSGSAGKAVQATTTKPEPVGKSPAVPDVSSIGKKKETKVLAGAGDIVLAVEQDDYKRIYVNSIAFGKLPFLYINGIGLGLDGKLISQLPCDNVVYLRFAVRQGPQSKDFWAALYATNGMTDPAFLNPGIAWDTNGPVSVLAPGDGVQIAVTSERHVTAAAGVVLLLLALSGWILVKTDTFRDAPVPQWLAQAQSLRAVATRQGVKVGDLSWVQQEFPAFNSANKTVYLAAANRVRAGILPAPEQEQDVLYGFLLDPKDPPDIRATYSLARTQLGMWFLFAVSAGIFLWIVYAQLPRIDGSLLVLLGLSVSTAGVSLAIDKSAAADDKRPFTISTNLLTDLVIGGANDKQQVYRYQAVVVNLLLLCVGIINVVQSLSYPLFDPTWLAFLGISGAALTLGKQVNET